jgi:hypothetical protein
MWIWRMSSSVALALLTGLCISCERSVAAPSPPSVTPRYVKSDDHWIWDWVPQPATEGDAMAHLAAIEEEVASAGGRASECDSAKVLGLIRLVNRSSEMSGVAAAPPDQSEFDYMVWAVDGDARFLIRSRVIFEVFYAQYDALWQEGDTAGVMDLAREQLGFGVLLGRNGLNGGALGSQRAFWQSAVENMRRVAEVEGNVELMRKVDELENQAEAEWEWAIREIKAARRE